MIMMNNKENTGIDDRFESKDTEKINMALIKAHKEFKPIEVDANSCIPKEDIRMSFIFRHIKDGLTKNDLIVTFQAMLTTENETILKTTLRHISGQWMCSYNALPVLITNEAFPDFNRYARVSACLSLLGITLP